METWGSNHTDKFSEDTWRHLKNRERRGPSRGVIQKCARNPCAPRFEERTQDETSHQERCARREAWDLAKDVYKLQKTDKATFTLLLKTGQRQRPLQNLQRNGNFALDSGASVHMLSKKDFSSEELETLRRSRTTTTVVTVNGEVLTSEETQVYVHDLDHFMTVHVLDDTPAVLSLGPLRRTRIYL